MPNEARRRRDEELVAAALTRLAAEEPAPPLPDPARLYWRAQILARLDHQQQLAQRAARPVRTVTWLAALLASAVIAWAISSLLGLLPTTPDPMLDTALQLGVVAGVMVLAGGAFAAWQVLAAEGA